MIFALAGPSGSGKSRAATETGIDFLELDAFFRDLDDPAVPFVRGRPDWADIRSYDVERAAVASRRLLAGEVTQIPIYSFHQDRCIGSTSRQLGQTKVLIIEGIFAFEVAKTIGGTMPVVRVLLRAGRVTLVLSRMRRDVLEGRLGRYRAAVESARLARSDRSYVVWRRAVADHVASRRSAVPLLMRLTAGAN